MISKPSKQKFEILSDLGSALLLSHLSKAGPLTAAIGFGLYNAISLEIKNRLYHPNASYDILPFCIMHFAHGFRRAALITDILSCGNRFYDAGIFGTTTVLVTALHASYCNINPFSNKDRLSGFISSTSCALLFNAARDTGLFTAANVAFRSVTGINAPMLAESVCFVFALPKASNAIKTVLDQYIPKF